ncbi:MAG: CHAD domain-containing protein [Elusimicrobia bacterium]|nr:CHAD domain-containing protein [Elusimicrobiota bacterium]
MKRFPRNLPERPGTQGAGLLALHRLDAAAAAAERLPRSDDSEALHDFRVALRRLRVVLRLYRQAFRGRVPRISLKRVRKLARDTNEARDTEVLEARLKGWADDLKPGHLPGADVLRRRLAKGRPEDGRGFIDAAGKEFHSLEGLLRPALLAVASTEERGPSFGAASAALLRDAGRDLRRRLSAIKTAIDDGPVHKARIAGKRLRYLLEPFQSRSFLCRKAIGRLKKLQEDLGDIHDLNLAVQAVSLCAKKDVSAWSRGLVEAASLEGTKAGRPSVTLDASPVPGLARLAALAGRDRARSFSRFEERWDGPKAGEFFSGLEAVAGRLSPRPANALPTGGRGLALQYPGRPGPPASTAPRRPKAPAAETVPGPTAPEPGPAS